MVCRCHRYPSCSNELTGFRSPFGTLHFVGSLRDQRNLSSRRCVHKDVPIDWPRYIDLFSHQAKHCQHIRQFVYTLYPNKHLYSTRGTFRIFGRRVDARGEKGNATIIAVLIGYVLQSRPFIVTLPPDFDYKHGITRVKKKEWNGKSGRRCAAHALTC